MSITESRDWWVKFVVRRVPVTAEKPHGLDYSLTLHGPGNARYAGYDSAHSITISSGLGSAREIRPRVTYDQIDLSLSIR